MQSAPEKPVLMRPKLECVTVWSSVKERIRMVVGANTGSGVAALQAEGKLALWNNCDLNPKEVGQLSITDKARPDWEGFNTEHRFNPPEKFYEGNGFETSSEASAEVAEEFGFLIKEEVTRLQTRIAPLKSQLAALEADGPRWEFTEYFISALSFWEEGRAT